MLPQGQASELAPTGAAARNDALWKGGYSVECRPQAPGVQDAGGVGPKLQAGPHLREGRSLLEKLHRATGAAGRKRCGKCADAATGDEEMGFHGADGVMDFKCAMRADPGLLEGSAQARDLDAGLLNVPMQSRQAGLIAPAEV
jgi:hypothetical protein